MKLRSLLGIALIGMGLHQWTPTVSDASTTQRMQASPVRRSILVNRAHSERWGTRRSSQWRTH